MGFKGFIHKEETKRKISETNKKEKNPNWRGGVSSSYYIRISDYNKPCSICNTLDKLREVHHIDKNQKNNQLDNLMLVCRSCHMKIHFKLGTRTNRINNWSKKYSQCIDCNTNKEKHWGNGLCIKCYSKKYYQTNNNKILLRIKIYRQQNKDKINKYKKDWRKRRKING